MSSSPEGDRPALRAPLRTLRLRSSHFLDGALEAPWRYTRGPSADAFRLYVVTDGECTVAPHEGKSETLGPGELALVPGGMTHDVASSLDVPPSTSEPLRHPVTETFATITSRGDGPRCRVLMGTLELEPGPALRILRQLPPVIKVFPKDDLSALWVPATVRMLRREAVDRRTAADEVMTRLADLLVLFMTRTWLEQADYDGGAPAAWTDERIGAVVARIHARPADDWTVADMAHSAGMSRSAFAARFTEVTGTTPLRMVTDRRMALALHMLQTSDDTVAAIAARCGYASEAGFGRAFMRAHATTPAAARRAAHHERIPS
ncbi:AraC family transcriptional regulator [Demequina zhanjiangensis]|uniref:AraC family transcriptional regulator n=1 Tax=Demequina zhanjiangensis TaxID=3051659 RepID=A0ABT8G1H6_9MICO|nr:AraC family transcriptional regulator [Demequina sp. SYSU T00b26]MDN4472985.1 AraC family transcriptional regulator [Demequina sp. SYSU T00b26]